jgi:hypothetical protein
VLLHKALHAGILLCMRRDTHTHHSNALPLLTNILRCLLANSIVTYSSHNAKLHHCANTARQLSNHRFATRP